MVFFAVPNPKYPTHMCTACTAVHCRQQRPADTCAQAGQIFRADDSRDTMRPGDVGLGESQARSTPRPEISAVGYFEYPLGIRLAFFTPAAGVGALADPRRSKHHRSSVPMQSHAFPAHEPSAKRLCTHTYSLNKATAFMLSAGVFQGWWCFCSTRHHHKPPRYQLVHQHVEPAQQAQRQEAPMY